MKKLKYIIVLLTLAAIALCACSRETPLQRALSTAKSEFGIDLKSENITVERLAYTYDDGNIFGEGFAAYKISFTQDASAHFAGLDTTPNIQHRKHRISDHFRCVKTTDVRENIRCFIISAYPEAFCTARHNARCSRQWQAQARGALPWS